MLLIFHLHVVHSQEPLKSHIGFTSNSSCCFPDCFFCKAVGDTVGRDEVFLCSIDGTCRNCLDPARFSIMMMINFHLDFSDPTSFMTVG